MRLVQIWEAASPVAAIVDGDALRICRDGLSVYDLAGLAERENTSLADVARGNAGDMVFYRRMIDGGAITVPYTHPDPFHMMVAGTGLSHLGSASTRAKMHAGGKPGELTDSMKMFQAGLEGGKPRSGEAGAMPEWFYKGDGSIVVPPGDSFKAPEFGADFGEEPELAALYRIGKDGTPLRIGFTLGNEASDHVTEKQNYLLLAHSKLRQCSIGPEILVGELPSDIRGMSRILRNDETVWEKEFLTGEDNMCHSIANLEYHHFKYALFRRPGQAHIHFLGTATLSFENSVKTQSGDVFEISARAFGAPLKNALQVSVEPPRALRIL